MTVKQISVFVENKPGMLAALADVLNENGINMRALSLAETKDFGIIRLILDDPFVNLDEEKIEHGKAFIREIAKEYQVIYFTCHESRA